MRGRSKIGLGTVQFGMDYGISNTSGQTEPLKVARILKLAERTGIQILDSASGYGNAEEVLGKNDLTGFRIVSKFLPPSKGEKVVDQFDLTLQKLKIKSLYGYLAHRPMELVDHPDQWEELIFLKEKGLVNKIGFSLNDPEEMEKLWSKGFKPDLIQVPYNYLDRRFEELIIKLKKEGCEIHTRSTFLQGLFFVNPDDLEDYFDEVKPLLYKLQDVDNIAGSLLNFALRKPFIDQVIVGIENEDQLIVNLKAIESSENLPELTTKVSNNILKPSLWPKRKKHV